MSAAAANDLARREDRLLLLAYASGAFAVALGLESWALGGVAAVTSLGALLARPRRLVAPPAREALLGLLAAAAGLPLAMFEQSAAPGLALFLLVAQAIKLGAPRGPRDESLALAVGVVLAGVAASEGVSPLFGALFLTNIATMLALAALRARRALLVRAAAEGVPVVDPGAATRQVAPAAARARAGLARARAHAPLLLVTLAFFAAFPRVGAHFLPSQRETRDRLSGFTDIVGLNDIGRIQQSDAIAFRAELLGGTLPAAPYWRGRAMDHYDGETWQTSRVFGFAGTRLEVEGDDGLKDPLVDVPAAAPRADVVIYQEPLGTRCLFTVGTVRSVQFKTARPSVIDRDALGAILCFRAPAVPVAYRLVAHPGVEVPRMHETSVTTRRIREACLRLPASVDRARLGAFLDEVLRARGVPADAPPSLVAQALEDHLSTTFRYTLDVGHTPGVEPVQDFLFEQRAGHCEYFASAMAVLLRLRGVPSRVVSGFRGGDYSPWSQAWTVRQRDAHAWVEAETERGWARYDPTPARAAGASAGGAFAEAAKALTDWLELRWYKWVIAYDAYDQRNALRALRELVSEAGAAARARLEGVSLDSPLKLAPLLVVAAGVVAGAVVFVRGRGARAAARLGLVGPDAPLVGEVLEALAARGVARREGETLKELVARARATLGPEVDGLVAWVPACYAARFGGQPSDPAANEGARRALAALRAPGRPAAPARA